MAARKKAKVAIVWRRGAFRDLRTMPEVMAELASKGQELATLAGDGYEASSPRATGGRGRGRVSVATATEEARRRESLDHNLLRALGGMTGLREYTSRAGKTSWITQAQHDNYSRKKKG